MIDWEPTVVIAGDDPGTPQLWIASTDGNYVAAFNCERDRLACLAALKNAALLEKENGALRKEVDALRAKLGMGRKYVEWSGDKATGGCPVSGG